MNFDKVKELARRHLLKTHLKIKDNVLYAPKLFIANSALNWVLKNTKDPKVIKRYVIDIEKYLRNEVELKWLNEYLLNEREFNDYKEKSTKEIAISGSK